jgi:hypothetical protein
MAATTRLSTGFCYEEEIELTNGAHRSATRHARVYESAAPKHATKRQRCGPVFVSDKKASAGKCWAALVGCRLGCGLL